MRAAVPCRLASLLLLIAVAPGCSLIVDGPEEDNAYTCECACDMGTPLMASQPVQAGADDAVELVATGAVDPGSGVLELSDAFLVGLRFDGLAIPPGATIDTAHVQFVADLDGMGATQVTIRVEDMDDAPAFTTSGGNVSGRDAVPDLDVPWTVAEWMESGADDPQRTPDLSPLFQAIVDRDDWTEGNAVVLIFETAGGPRVAESFEDGDVPVLELSFFQTIAARLPVCEPDPGGVAGDDDDMETDCTGRVENAFNQLTEGCGYVQNAASRCSCELVPTGFRDEEGEDPYFEFEHAACEGDCEVVEVDATCSNFDPAGFDACLADELAACVRNDKSRADCVLSEECRSRVSATTDRAVCIAATGDGGDEPEPMGQHLLGQRSTCEVTGSAEVLVGDEQEEPKKQPAAFGTLGILGRPCPGDTCPVSISSQLALEPITFDVKFRPDPTFVDLLQTGDSLVYGPVVGGPTAGILPGGTARAVSGGRRSGDDEDEAKAVTTTNDEDILIDVDWATRHCGIQGNLTGTVDAEGAEGTCAGDDATPCFVDSPDCDEAGGPCELPEDPSPLVASVDLIGTLVNQPPTARAGDARTVECTSPAGAGFQLDGSSSSDPDDGPGLFPDIRAVSWRVGDRFGTEIGSQLQVSTALGVGGFQTYLLRVIDSHAQADEDTTAVMVVDTTAPQISCNAPATIAPPESGDEPAHPHEAPAEPVAFTATASDVCDAAVAAEVLGFDCFAIKRNGRRVDKTQSCGVAISGDTVTILDTGGVGTHVTWQVRAVDDSGNAAETECEVEVANPS